MSGAAAGAAAAATVAVAGATGALGRHVLPRLLARGHRVRALARDDAAARRLARLGVEPVRGDLLRPESLPALVRDCAVAMHLATAIPRGGRGDWTADRRVRTEGTANLLDASRRAGVTRYVQQSVAFLQASDGDAWTDESTPARPTPVTQAAFEMEALVRASALPWTIVRGGLFYGAGTGTDDAWREAARRGELRVPGRGDGWVSLVHVSDMAEAVAHAATRAASGATLAVVDDAPITWRTLFAHVCALEGAPPPVAGGAPAVLPSFRARNARAKEALGWRPHYADFRCGIA